LGVIYKRISSSQFQHVTTLIKLSAYASVACPRLSHGKFWGHVGKPADISADVIEAVFPSTHRRTVGKTADLTADKLVQL